MIIKRIDENEHVTICIKGRIDAVTSDILRENLAQINYEKVKSLTLNFKDVEYISSSGLRELLIAKKKANDKDLSIINVSEAVAEVFEITGFSCVLDFTMVSGETDYAAFSFKELLEYKVKTCADKTVVSDSRSDYTWLDIEKCSQIIANDLSAHGVKRGTHVAICGSNSINWIYTFYAIQKLGAIAVLINPTLSAKEIARLSRIGDITHLCFGQLYLMNDDNAFIEEVKNNSDSKIKSFYDIRTSICFRDRESEYSSIQSLYTGKVENDDISVMIFTSGSTGSPKGVLLSSYNIMNAAVLNIESIRLTENDRACLILPLFHIFGLVAGLIANNIVDAELVFPKSIRTNDLLDEISSRKCTVLHSVPTMMLSIVNNTRFDSKLVSNLRCSILSGAATSKEQMLMLFDKFPNNHFISSYGLSEMAPVSITDYEDTVEHLTQTVGKPLRNLRVKIFNKEEENECKAGDVGEILVQGSNLMSGYYKYPIEEQDFDMDGWLHTGDLGSIDHEGYIHFIGRIKDLIIRGGENIIPSEVAASISEEDCVADVKVIGTPDDFWGEIVVCALVLKSGYAFDEEQMRTHLKTKLAKFKIPEHFIIYDSFPMLSNGKTNLLSLKKDLEEKVRNLKIQ